MRQIIRAGAALAAVVASILLAGLSTVLSTACGGDLGGDGGDGDGGAECDMFFSTTGEAPGDVVVATGGVFLAEASGTQVFDWSVEYGGAAVDFRVTGAVGDIIEFDAERAGVYEIELDGTVGGFECDGHGEELNIVPPDATRQSFVLRVVPATGGDVPAQDVRLDDVPGVDEYALGVLNLEAGVAVDGVLFGPGGEPLAGYLRATEQFLTGPPLLQESFASADGAFTMLLPDAPYEILVVPDGDVAPFAREGARPIDLVDIAVPAGEAVTGSVTDPSGDPLPGARVSLVVAGVPSTVATSDAGGRFTLQARTGGPVSVSVTAPPASGLPDLALAAAEAVAIGSDSVIDVGYAASLTSRAVSAIVTERDGASPAPGARVTWIARPIAAAATITIDRAGEAATGSLRRAVDAGDGGDLPATALPAAIYDVVVEPPVGAAATEGIRVVEIDLQSGPTPASFALAAPARLTGQVLAPVSGGDEPLAGARIQAVPRGLLAASTRAGAATRSGEDGAFSLLVAGGGEYDLVADGAAQGEGRVRWRVTAPASGDDLPLTSTSLPDGLRLYGSVSVPGASGLASASVQLFCLDCSPDQGAAPVAESVTDPTGGFVLVAPDPGIVEELR